MKVKFFVGGLKYPKLFFLGDEVVRSPSRYVVDSSNGRDKAVYRGEFDHGGDAPSGVIRSLALYRDGALQARFTKADWDAEAFFEGVVRAVKAGNARPLLDLVRAGDDLGVGSDGGDLFSGGDGQARRHATHGADSTSGGH